MTLMAIERTSLVEYACQIFISHGFKVIAMVKVENRETNKQTGQKQYAPIILSGSKKNLYYNEWIGMQLVLMVIPA